MSEMSESELVVRHAPERSRFEIVIGDDVATLAYTRDGNRISLDHTEVPPSLEGRGVGSRLARGGLEFARAHRLRVIVFCPFVRAYLQRHPEYADLVVRH